MFTVFPCSSGFHLPSMYDLLGFSRESSNPLWNSTCWQWTNQWGENNALVFNSKGAFHSMKNSSLINFRMLPVMIETTFSWISGKEDNFARYMYTVHLKFSENSYPEFSVSFDFPPGILRFFVECFAFLKFGSFWIFWKLFQEMSRLLNNTISAQFEIFQTFDFGENGKYPQSIIHTNPPSAYLLGI